MYNGLYPAIMNNETLSFAETWKELKIISSKI